MILIRLSNSRKVLLEIAKTAARLAKLPRPFTLESELGRRREIQETFLFSLIKCFAGFGLLVFVSSPVFFLALSLFFSLSFGFVLSFVIHWMRGT